MTRNSDVWLDLDELGTIAILPRLFIWGLDTARASDTMIQVSMETYS